MRKLARQFPTFRTHVPGMVFGRLVHDLLGALSPSRDWRRFLCRKFVFNKHEKVAPFIEPTAHVLNWQRGIKATQLTYCWYVVPYHSEGI